MGHIYISFKLKFPKINQKIKIIIKNKKTARELLMRQKTKQTVLNKKELAFQAACKFLTNTSPLILTEESKLA